MSGDIPRHRYAIYFVPDCVSSLGRYGRRILGGKGPDGAAGSRWQPAGIDPEEIADITAAPRRYGFHATLKAPFCLSDDYDEQDLIDEAARFCIGRAAIELPRLAVGTLSDFVALRPVEPVPAVDQFAAECVRHFDRFRARVPGTAAAHSRDSGLDPRERELMEQWGYPYVLDRYRFHMTLSCPLDPRRRKAFCVAAAQSLPDLGPCRLDAVTICREELQDRTFRAVARLRLTG